MSQVVTSEPNIKAIRPLLVLAPMAGITDWAFREMCLYLGVDLVVVPFVSAQGVARQPRRVIPKLGTHALHSAVYVQLYGKHPEDFRLAATRLTDTMPIAGIDINMGCPAPQVVRSNHGSALLKDAQLGAEIVSQTRAGTNLPVSVKMRLGWEESQMPELAITMQAAGASMLTIHGRTREQLFKGPVDLESIALVKKTVTIPVIANGDIRTVADARFMLETTNADGVMVGRGAMTDPAIFAKLREELRGDPSFNAKAPDAPSIIRKHVELAFSSEGHHAALTIRKHLIAHLKGIYDAGRMRRRTEFLHSRQDVDDWVDEFERLWMGRGRDECCPQPHEETVALQTA